MFKLFFILVSKSVSWILWSIFLLSWIEPISAELHFGLTSTNVRLPKPQNGEPLQILLDIPILDIEKVDCLKMEMSVHFVLRQTWNDSTVRFKTDSSGHQNESIWIPETIILNQRDFNEFNFGKHQHKILYHDKGSEITKLDRISATVKCKGMDFHLYPFDHQPCRIHFQNSLYSAAEVQYKWKNIQAPELAQKMVLPFSIINTEYEENSTTSMVSFGSSNEHASQVSVIIEFRRAWNAYVQRFHVPMTIFVGTSLLSLWLVHPKISFLVNFANITFVNIFLAIWELSSDIPKVNYKTALDAYSIICQFFIILILVLNVYILFYLKHDEDNNDRVSNNGGNRASSRASHEQRYFLPKTDSSGNIAKGPHPYLKTIHGSSYAAGDSSNNVIDTHQQSQPPDEIDVMGYPTKKRSAACSNWNLIKAKLLDQVRRTGHLLLLSTFVATFLLYWITLLGIHYS